jgi:HPt (histidine-containing phosphotransfer) domain-containing protein
LWAYRTRNPIAALRDFAHELKGIAGDLGARELLLAATALESEAANAQHPYEIQTRYRTFNPRGCD